MLPSETWVAINAYWEKENDQVKDNWERARWVGTNAYNSNGFLKKTKSPKDLLPFPWEKDSSPAPQEVENLRKEMGWQLPEQH